MNISYEEFFRLVDVELNIYQNKTDLIEEYKIHDINKEINSININSLIVGESVVLYGAEGGSCWDDSEVTYYETGNTVSDCEDMLIKLLKIIDKENISYIKAKALKDLFISDEKTISEYYGNSKTFGFIYLNLNDFYQKIIEITV